MSLLDRLRGRGSGGLRGVDQTYAGLRSMVLELDAGKVGPSAIEGLSRVYGAVVDWSLGDDFATFVALGDGTASMYTSRGGGTIGAGGRPGIDAAGARLLRTVETSFDEMAPIEAIEPPVVGAVRYWAMTRDGLRSTSHDASGPPDDSPVLQALGDAFQKYGTAFRQVDQERRRLGSARTPSLDGPSETRRLIWCPSASIRRRAASSSPE